MKYSLGRYVYGLAAIGFGICALAWHDINNLQQIEALGDVPHREILAYIVSTIEILGGVAVQWPRTARAGAVALGTIYFIFALLGLPHIIEHPLVYNGFGNFFEQFSLASGAMILYACSGPIAPARTARLAQIGYYSFGICVVSFALEQLFYLSATASLVPKWISPGQMFWAMATTAAFALAAIALLTGFMARLASRLTTAMIVGFGLLVWLPALFADPHSFQNWSESVETLAIAASAWIVADFLDQRRSASRALIRIGAAALVGFLVFSIPAGTSHAAGISPVSLYPVPSPLPSGKPGAIIWSRAVTGGSTLRGAASNTLVLYHTVSVSGHDIAVSGLVSLPTGPPPAGGWPIISWAHGTTGNAPQCAPSRFTKQNNEQRFLEQWIAAGFAIAQTDYEGESTPGLHPYFSGTAGARDTIDIVRAARQAYPQIGGRWFVMGHSEGGTVALFTAADAQAWGPGMQLLGAVAYAPGTGVTGFVGQMMMTQQPTALLPYAAMMVEGIASTDPALDLRTIFSAQGLALLPSLQSECLDALMSAPSWRSMPPAQMFRPNAVSDALLHDFEINEPSTLTIHVPLLIEQGRNDDLVPYALTADLRSGLCANGTRLELDAVDNATHQTVLPDSFERVKTWILDRLAGKPATPNCP